MPKSTFLIEPFSENCHRICQRREHVLCGVSPGNSYFSVPLLTDLLGWLCAEFASVDVVIPDSALPYTYQAMGYSPERAVRKADGTIRTLRNRVRRAWETQGGPRPTDHVHMMSDFARNHVYQDLLAQCEEVAAEEGVVRETCLEMSRHVLSARRDDGTDACGPNPQDAERGMRYLIAELPFILAAADILAVPSSLSFYHQPLPLAQLMFSRASRLLPSPRQGFAVIRPAGPSAERTGEQLPPGRPVVTRGALDQGADDGLTPPS